MAFLCPYLPHLQKWAQLRCLLPVFLFQEQPPLKKKKKNQNKFNPITLRSFTLLLQKAGPKYFNMVET